MPDSFYTPDPGGPPWERTDDGGWSHSGVSNGLPVRPSGENPCAYVVSIAGANYGMYGPFAEVADAEAFARRLHTALFIDLDGDPEDEIRVEEIWTADVGVIRAHGWVPPDW